MITTLLLWASLALADPPTSMHLAQIPDASLIDQRGKTRNLRKDLVEGHLVAMNFIFTSCPSICPPMGASFAQLQHIMRDKHVPVTFISISIDPTTDTPAELARWSAQFGGTEDWVLLTGEPTQVDRVLNDLGVLSSVREDHAPVVLLGDATTGRWVRAYGLAPPTELAEELLKLRGGAQP